MELFFPLDLIIAVGLGLLAGLQREWVASRVAGIRTFPLITVLGYLTAELAERFGGWVVVAALLSLGAALVLANVAKLKTEHIDPGITTEVAVLVMFGVGAGLAAGYAIQAIVIGGLVPILLHWKRPMHRLARQLGADDFRAIIRLALIAIVILPLLPNRALGPYGVLNPFEIWLMVVLIVGISLAAYVGYKLLGTRGGMLAAGILGGLISSTAATLGYSRQARRAVERSRMAGAAIMIAGTVVFVRVLVELAIVTPQHLLETAPPLAAVMGFMAVISGAAFIRARRGISPTRGEDRPPSDLKAAILFGLAYGAVLLAVAIAKERYGSSGLFVVAGLSGLTDMDAITLSTAQLIKVGELDPETGWRVVLVGAMANLAFKTSMVAAVGGRPLFRRILVMFGLSLAGCALVLWLWR